jgi:signal transduction histidine kinase
MADDDLARLKAELDREREGTRRLRKRIAERNEALASASHELRTPLAAMMGFARTLLQPEMGSNEELRQELLDRMVQQGDRLLQEIHTTLTDAQLDPDQRA